MQNSKRSALLNKSRQSQHGSHMTSYAVFLICIIISAVILLRSTHMADAASLKIIHPHLTFPDSSDFPLVCRFQFCVFYFLSFVIAHSVGSISILLQLFF